MCRDKYKTSRIVNENENFKTKYFLKNGTIIKKLLKDIRISQLMPTITAQIKSQIQNEFSFTF